MINLDKKREVDKRAPYLGNKLIFCEGKTELNYLNYFKSLLDKSSVKYNRRLYLEPVNAKGGGVISIFNFVEDFLSRNENKKYQYFDKIIILDLDDPEDKDIVINTMIDIKKSDFNLVPLYSYKTFEVWLLMHISNVEEPLSKKRLKICLKENLNIQRYKKSDEGMIAKLVHDKNNVRNAIDNSKRLISKYSSNNLKLIPNYKEMNPYTNVHLLVEEILNNLEWFEITSSKKGAVKKWNPNGFRIALIHYQFETIHPFLDGNGRIGRLLISLLLKHYGLLDEDILYLSYYLKRNRIEYYDRLMDVRLKGHYEEWLEFFMDGILESSKHALNTIEALLNLRKENLKKLNQLQGKRKQSALLLFNYLESHPIIDIKQASIGIKKAFNTVSNAVDTLVELGILKQVDGHKRYRIFAYDSYLRILRDGTN